MTNLLFRNILIMAAMIGAALFAIQLKPTILMSSQHERVVLEDVVPKKFGDWKLFEMGSGVIVNPQVEAQLSEIYSQTLSRTYVNSNNEYVMLSIAYGNNQSRHLQVHRPEVCYVAQGFQISGLKKNSIVTEIGNIPVMNLIAQQGKRTEPITYWVRMGNEIVRGNLEQGLARLEYGLHGFIPDGLLFRVSTINNTEGDSYQLQEKFINEMLKSIPKSQLPLIIGNLGMVS